jgi:putative redox protein
MLVTARSADNLQVEITAGNHTWIADEPIGVGDDAGPDPYGLLLGALASCTVITLHMYARRKGWPLERVDMDLSIVKMYARDCPQCQRQFPADTMIDVIDRKMRFSGPLSAEQIGRLTEIADRCPVHRTLSGEIVIRTEVTA